MRRSDNLDGFLALDSSDTQVLGSREERQLLQELGECKRKLANALAQIPGFEMSKGADDPQALAQLLD